jgi:hypothetical protein
VKANAKGNTEAARVETSTKKKSLLQVLAALKPLREDFPFIHDSPPESD